MNWELEIAKLNLNLQRIENFIDLAIAALEEGQDSPSLRILAGLFKNDPVEIREYLHKTLSELNIKEPSKDEAAWPIIKEIVDDIINKKISPHKGIHSIIWDVYHKMDWDEKNGKYAGDCIGIEKLYGLCDSYDDLLNAENRRHKFKTNQQLLDELEIEIYKEIIEFKRTKFT